MSSWYDMIVCEEEARASRLERMTEAQWKQEAKRIIATWTGDLRDCLNTLDRMEAERAVVAPVVTVAVPYVRTARDVMFAMWRDMVEEPEKYGDDIAQWLELDANLRIQPGHWRLNAYWYQKDAELEAKMAEEAREQAATRIQALVRGHQVRTSNLFHDCCMCLSHRICPLKTEVGMMCRECAEQGPHDDITGCEDPWNWFRADYVDLAPAPVPAPVRVPRAVFELDSTRQRIRMCKMELDESKRRVAMMEKMVSNNTYMATALTDGRQRVRIDEYRLREAEEELERLMRHNAEVLGKCDKCDSPALVLVRMNDHYCEPCAQRYGY